MKKRVSKRYNVKNAVLLLVLLAVFIIVSTYAWFTTNRFVRVEEMQVNIAASEGFQISSDAMTWKTLVTTSDLVTGVGAGATRNKISDNMDPISTAFERITAADNTKGELQMYLRNC